MSTSKRVNELEGMRGVANLYGAQRIGRGKPPAGEPLTARTAACAGAREVPPLLRLPPLYCAHNLRAAYALRYDWTGWPTEGTSLPEGVADVARTATSAWEADGLHLLEAHATAEKVQILFSATPQVSPIFCSMRAKGRLQHALRKAGKAVIFSRKVSFRSLGDNTTPVVDGYIRGQVGKGAFADPRFQTTMRRFTVTRPEVDLALPTATDAGRYWYNLHVVLVVADRFRITDPDRLGRVRDAVFTVAGDADCRVAAVAVMPDHLHLALRGGLACSPEEIALAFQNGLARAAGCRAWQDGYYAGTFSEYDVGVIRRITTRA